MLVLLDWRPVKVAKSLRSNGGLKSMTGVGGNVGAVVVPEAAVPRAGLAPIPTHEPPWGEVRRSGAFRLEWQRRERTVALAYGAIFRGETQSTAVTHYRQFRMNKKCEDPLTGQTQRDRRQACGCMHE